MDGGTFSAVMTYGSYFSAVGGFSFLAVTTSAGGGKTKIRR